MVVPVVEIVVAVVVVGSDMAVVVVLVVEAVGPSSSCGCNSGGCHRDISHIKPEPNGNFSLVGM